MVESSDDSLTSHSTSPASEGRDRQQRFRLLARTVPCMLWQSDSRGGSRFLSDGWLSFTGRIDSRASRTGWADNVHPDDLQTSLARYSAAFDARREFRAEYRVRHREGQYRWILDHGRPDYDEDNRFVGFIGVAIDIHERRLAEEGIRSELRQKEVLLRELHHRVKNNMQIVNSLLSRQSRRLERDADRALLQEVKDRIRAMALVHERLLASGNLHRVDMRGYASDISVRLLGSFGVQNEVSIEVVADPIVLPIESAVPCGLILNELLTNSIKHGRNPGPGASRIRVGMSYEGKRIAILVADNGTGFPPSIRNATHGGAGLDLARSLTRQLQGTIMLGNANGAYVCVSFPCPGEYLPSGRR